MSYLRVIALITCLVVYTDATTITLYRAQAPLPTPPPGLSIEQAGTTVYSALGPGESGMTKYEVQDIRSRVVIHDQAQTLTIVDGHTTVLKYTIEQGASAIHENYPPLMLWPTSAGGVYVEAGIDADCVLNGQDAECKGERLFPLLADRTDATSVLSPVATTYSVKATPVATITVDGGSGSGSGGNGGGKTGSATRGAVGVEMGAMSVCMAVVMGALGVML